MFSMELYGLYVPSADGLPYTLLLRCVSASGQPQLVHVKRQG